MRPSAPDRVQPSQVMQQRNRTAPLECRVERLERELDHLRHLLHVFLHQVGSRLEEDVDKVSTWSPTRPS